MATEIERKYLVRHLDDVHDIIKNLKGKTLHQGYLSLDPERTVRLRIIEPDGVAKITIKGSGNGVSRPEFEYNIPLHDAKEMMSLTLTDLSKTRYCYQYLGHTLEIDVFHGRHKGLILVEIELESEHERIDLPSWIGEEVTHLSQYSNAALSQK